MSSIKSRRGIWALTAVPALVLALGTSANAASSSQIGDQANSGTQSATGGTALAAQVVAVNANAPISILSPGSSSTNNQSNSSTVDASASNSNDTTQGISQTATSQGTDGTGGSGCNQS